MPLPDTSPEFKAKVLTAGGYDPSKYSMDDDGNVSQIFDTSPSISTTHDPIEEPPVISTKPQQSSTAMQAAGHSALASILPTGAGLGAGAGVAALLAPETGGLSLLGLLAPLLAGGAASYGTSKLQSAVLPDDINKQLATEQEEHPIASAVGGLAPSLPFFNPIKGAAELPSLIRSGGKALSRGLPALTDAEQALLANTAANVGVASGQDIASQLMSGKPFDWSQLGVNVAGAGLLNSPTKLGSKVFDNFGVRPRTGDAQPTVSQADDIVTTKPASVDYSTPSPLSGEAPNPTAGLMQNISTRPELRNGPLKNVAERSDAMANYRGNQEANPEDLARMEGEGGPPAPTTIEDVKELLEEHGKEQTAKSKEAQVAESSGGSTQPEPTREVYPPKELTDKEIYTPKGALYQKEPALPAKTETKAQTESAPKVSDEDARLLLRNAPYDYKQKVLTLAAKRGISVHEAMNIVNPETGKQVLGAAEVENRKQTLSISKAQLDTPIHETSHQYLDDLLNSSSASDKKLAQRALNIFGGDRVKAEEALVSKLGVEGTKRASVDLYSGKLDKFNAWFDDFKSRWKNNLGLANDADTIRHLSARTFHDAPYGTRGELVGREKYNALVGQYKETKDPEQKFAIQSDIEKLKNETGGNVPKFQEEPALSSKLFSSNAEKELIKDRPFGLETDKNGKLPIMTVRSKLEKLIPKEELSSLKESGLEKAIMDNRDAAGKVDLKELSKWIGENGPKIEVRKFGEGGQSKETSTANQLQHEFETRFGSRYRIVNEYGDVDEAGRVIPAAQITQPDARDLAMRYRQAYAAGNLIDTSGSKSHWQSISPKPESEMKGYTEIAVVKPTKDKTHYGLDPNDSAITDKARKEMQDDGIKFGSSHNFPPNTLAWVRGHMETNPTTGKKTFLIHEVQSDWAQQYKADEERFQEHVRHGRLQDTELGRAGYADTLKNRKDPLLSHYESLALKAAIEHARSEGADSIAISDADTAMLTEGHDRQVGRDVPYANTASKAELDEMISQAKGMRQHYDESLPNIAKKLTGQEGELQSFGEHKMAFERSGTTDRQNEESYNQWLRNEQQPRKDLVFRNPDGTPKTDVTARVYPIDSVSVRREAGEPFTMTGSKYQSESALRPEDVKLGDKNTLSKTQPDSNNESDAITLKPFRSETDTILAKDGSRAKPFTNAIQEHNNLREEYTAKYNDEMQKVVKPLSEKDKDTLERTLIAENASDTSYRDTLKTPELQDAYDKLRSTMKQMQEDKIAANQPTYEMNDKGQSVPREAKIDPFYWPNNMSPEVINTLKNHANSPQAEALKKDWTEFQAKHGMNEKASSDMLDNILGSYSKQTPNLAHFRGVDIEQGHGLPQSFMRPGIERNIERYTKRFSNARAYHDAVESQPSVAPLIGIKNDPWGKPFEGADSVKPLKSQEAQDAFHRMTGSNYDANDSKVKAAERIGSSLILGPATSLHIYASTVANALTHAMPSETAGMVKSMSSDIREGFDHAQKSGILSVKSFKRIVSDFFDAHSTATEKLNSLSDLIAKVSGRDALGNLAKAQAQIGGEFLVKSRIPLAKLGPESGNAAKQAIRFMKQVDPYWNPTKEYSESDIAKMGSNFARSLHGHSSATQPSWMLKDNIIQPFVSLMSWNIAQTNAFMKNVYTPAIRDKNFIPLLMSTLGATLGGYIIKEAREKLMDKKSPIPSFSELAASDKGLSGNLPLIAYNLMAMTSFAGLGGILSTGARTAFDVAYKNPAQGAVFPLDEVISNTARTASQAYGALANSPLKDYPLIGTKAVGDLLRENIQLARIGLSWGDETGVLGEERANKKKLNVEEGDLRRYKVAEGMPYDDQSSIDESNPYFNLGRKQFQKTRDIGEAMKELPDLISQAVDESNGNIETLKNKLRALKESSYPSMPSPERTPMTFWKYIQYLNETEGPEKASQRVSEYMQNNMINKIKGSMVPSL